MNFNKFVKKMRDTPEYDILLEAKEEQNLPLTSKEYLAVFYANDLFDNKFKLPQILKLFPKEYWTIVGETLRGRIKPEGICVAWRNVGVWCNIADKYNKAFVKDTDYLEAYYPRINININS